MEKEKRTLAEEFACLVGGLAIIIIIVLFVLVLYYATININITLQVIAVIGLAYVFGRCLEMFIGR